jgi:hypothetical protein
MSDRNMLLLGRNPQTKPAQIHISALLHLRGLKVQRLGRKLWIRTHLTTLPKKNLKLTAKTVPLDTPQALEYEISWP